MEASGRIGRPGIERVLQQLVHLRPLLDHEVDEIETPATVFESVVTKLKFSERFQQTEKLSLKLPETTPDVGVGVVDRKRVAVRKFFGQKCSTQKVTKFGRENGANSAGKIVVKESKRNQYLL